MRSLVAAELLELWERERLSPPWQKALSLLTIACPDYSPDDLATLAIGRRDGLLFQLREWTFGNELASMARCPECSEQVEFVFTAGDIGAVPYENDGSPGSPSDPEIIDFRLVGYRGRVRLPNTRDMAAIAAIADQQAAYDALLASCVVELSPLAGKTFEDESKQDDDLPASTHSLPADVQAAIVQAIQAADPLADIEFVLACPNCAHQWSAPFDIVSFFWSEIDDWAGRTLREVHVLASAYGWSENEILAMSAGRRRLYLEMVYG